MKINSKLVVISCTSIAMLYACSHQQVDEIIGDRHAENTIRPPFKGIDVKKDVYSINPTERTEIITKEGTSIIIPANALVDEKGKRVKGKVSLSYRSINTPGEIIASGIPMRYDSAGVEYDFVSAGMFEIEAKVKDKEVFIAEGKKIDVNFGSYKEGTDFSFYKIEEETGKWSFKGRVEPKKNEGKIKRLQTFEDNNLVDFDIDYSGHEELKPFHDLNLKWLCIDPKEKDNPITHDWVAKERWFDISLNILNKKEGIYRIKLSNSSKTAEFKVSPYQLGKGAIASLNEKIDNMNEVVRGKKIEEERIQFEADISRNFSISSFGTYNWDKVEKEVEAGNLFVTNASFKVNEEALDKEINIYHFSGKDKLLSRIDKRWEKLIFDPKETNKILVVLPENYVALSTSSEFDKAKDNKEFIFNLKKRSQKIKSIQELDELLARK